MTLARIIAIAVLAHMAFVAARLTASLYALANHASTFTVGVIMALFSLVPMLIAVRAGRWLDAVGARRPVLIGMLLILAGVLLPAAFPYATADLAPLLVAAALIGTGQTLTMLSIQKVVGDRADPNRRAVAFSWLALGASVSGFTGPVLSGLFIDSFGHRATFGALMGVMLLALAFAWVNRGLLPAREGRVSGPEPMHPFELLKHTELRHVLIATALVSMSWDLQTFVIPVHGTRVGLSASEIGFVLGSFAVATFTIRLAMPRLSQRFTEWQVLTYTLFCATLAFGLFPFFSSLVPLMVVAFLLGLGLAPARAQDPIVFGVIVPLSLPLQVVHAQAVHQHDADVGAARRSGCSRAAGAGVRILSRTEAPGHDGEDGGVSTRPAWSTGTEVRAGHHAAASRLGRKICTLAGSWLLAPGSSFRSRWPSCPRGPSGRPSCSSKCNRSAT
jgi:predicted MFS family arabinose efflux permease